MGLRWSTDYSWLQGDSSITAFIPKGLIVMSLVPPKSRDLYGLKSMGSKKKNKCMFFICLWICSPWVIFLSFSPKNHILSFGQGTQSIVLVCSLADIHETFQNPKSLSPLMLCPPSLNLANGFKL